MLLDQIALRFEKLQQRLEYSLEGPASEFDITEAEKRLNISFPEQVRSFYQQHNGLRVNEPPLEILPIQGLNLASPVFLHFATLNESIPLFFDVSRINEANQWDIVSVDGIRVTLTMATFGQIECGVGLRRDDQSGYQKRQASKVSSEPSLIAT